MLLIGSLPCFFPTQRTMTREEYDELMGMSAARGSIFGTERTPPSEARRPSARRRHRDASRAREQRPLPSAAVASAAVPAPEAMCIEAAERPRFKRSMTAPLEETSRDIAEAAAAALDDNAQPAGLQQQKQLGSRRGLVVLGTGSDGAASEGGSGGGSNPPDLALEKQRSAESQVSGTGAATGTYDPGADTPTLSRGPASPAPWEASSNPSSVGPWPSTTRGPYTALSMGSGASALSGPTRGLRTGSALGPTASMSRFGREGREGSAPTRAAAGNSFMTMFMSSRRPAPPPVTITEITPAEEEAGHAASAGAVAAAAPAVGLPPQQAAQHVPPIPLPPMPLPPMPDASNQQSTSAGSERSTPYVTPYTSGQLQQLRSYPGSRASPLSTANTSYVTAINARGSLPTDLAAVIPEGTEDDTDTSPTKTAGTAAAAAAAAVGRYRKVSDGAGGTVEEVVDITPPRQRHVRAAGAAAPDAYTSEASSGCDSCFDLDTCCTGICQRSGAELTIQRLYQFAVEVWPAPNESVFRRSKMVTVKNKYLILNTTGLAIEYKQKGTPDPQPGMAFGSGPRFSGCLQHNWRAAWHWDNAHGELQMLIRPAEGDWEWSGRWRAKKARDSVGHNFALFSCECSRALVKTSCQCALACIAWPSVPPRCGTWHSTGCPSKGAGLT